MKSNLKTHKAGEEKDSSSVLPRLLEQSDSRVDINRSLELDQFFTKPEVAQSLFEITKKYILEKNIKFDIWLEPSAGSGAFYNLMPNPKMGYDIDKKINGVIESNFLDIELDKSKKYLVLGNPPFGKNSSLAIKFFNHCAKYASVIAFIVPKTFKKASVQDKLDKTFSLVLEQSIEENSFTLDGADKLVPCVFQIWEKTDTVRDKKIKIMQHADLIFTDKNEADFAFQRVGVNAGRIKPKDLFDSISSESHFFIKSEVKGIVEILNSINWNTIKFNTAGNPSISKAELIERYTNIKDKVIYAQNNLVLSQSEKKDVKILTYCDALCIMQLELKTPDIKFNDALLTLSAKSLNYTFKDKAQYMLFKKNFN